jgi:hypothetical protein
MTELERFLAESPVAEGVALPTRLVLEHRRLSGADIEAIRATGTYEASPGALCELEAGGQVIAGGKIVKRRGKFFLKVLETGGAK